MKKYAIFARLKNVKMTNEHLSSTILPRSRKMRARYRVAVIGSGSWATAIVKIISVNLEHIHWWVRQEEVADAGAVVFLLQISFYVFDYFLWRIALRRIRRLQELDEEMGISPEQPDDIDWRRIPPKV